MLGDIEAWKSGDTSENLGEIVRSAVSNEARKASEKQDADDRFPGEAGQDKGAEKFSDTPAKNY